MAVYFLQCTATGRIKIGYSRRAGKRAAEVGRGCPAPLIILGVIEEGDPALEQELQHRFAALRVYNEWFMPGDDLLAFCARHRQPEPMPPTRHFVITPRSPERHALDRLIKLFGGPQKMADVLSVTEGTRTIGREAIYVWRKRGIAGRWIPAIQAEIVRRGLPIDPESVVELRQRPVGIVLPPREMVPAVPQDDLFGEAA